ncbi:phosphatase PAP2 family protein [Nakamurella endophytica]|uniref:Glycerophosphatase n=1 Tax=Nakamurella endophytica TaxID=1748367 RepID=A0A917T0Y7_9ACTN|nr:phosphatase PAP2 family protein [Nakamurella endophytica]GGM06476.1 glycerophosphatase [Nakamurella endophytica]
MRTTDEAPDPSVVPAPVPLPRPVDRAMRILTTSANHGVLWFGLAAAGWLAGKRPRRAALRGVASLALSSTVANSVIKPLVGRRRPDAERTAVARRIGRVPWTSSFPSGHAASAAAFATGATLEYPAAAAVLAPLAGAVAYSRVHVGVHYPSDVVTGAAIGTAVAFAGRRLWPVKPWGPADTAPATAPALPRGRGLTIVVNDASGTAKPGREQLSELLPEARIVAWDPTSQDLGDVLGERPQAVGVAGGDGTAAAVAAWAHDHGLPLAVFPFGTLNHFAVALGLVEPALVAQAVENGRAGAVDLATVDGRPFLNTASIGGYPEMVQRRDRMTARMGKWPATGYALFRTLLRHRPLQLQIDGRTLPVWIVFVGNGRYRPRGLAPAWRDDLASGVLDVQYLRADRPLSRTRGILYSVLGLVERSTVFEALDLPRVRIRSLSGPLPPAFDGEVGDPVDEVEFAVDPRRLTVYHLPAGS